MLEGNVQLYELRNATGAAQPATAKGTSAGVSLHAKAIVVDRQLVFIGSMNMDQRSKLLNTEMGVIVDSPPLAEAVKQFFDTAVLPANAYEVRLADSAGRPGTGKMQWHAMEGNEPVISNSDPDATMKRKAEVRVLRLLPVEGLL